MNKGKCSIKVYSFGLALLFWFVGLAGDSVTPALRDLGVNQNEIKIVKTEQKTYQWLNQKTVARKSVKSFKSFFSGYFAKCSETNQHLVTLAQGQKTSSYLDTFGLVPPLGGLEGKLIEINLSRQTFTCWENGRVWGHFLTSTGRPGMATKTGMFSILDHYPMAWSESAGCWMPWWMGIYWAGSTENGIHEMPIFGGVRESPADLGYPVSHGCVRLAVGVAKNVYDWATEGTPVYIHY